MKLTQKALCEREAWEQKGYQLPRYDREAMVQKTVKDPVWVHFGAGNIFRGFPAALQQKLLDEGKSEQGITVCEGFDTEIIEKAYRPFDNLSLLVVLKADGTIRKEVIGSVAESLALPAGESADWERIQEIFRSSSLQMVSFTITEKGYSLTDAAGNWTVLAQKDFEGSDPVPTGLMGKITALCLERYHAGEKPLSLVSMDNCSQNGQKLQNAVLQTAEAWVKNGKAPAGFLDYLKDPKKIAFPWTIIDKITPRPDPVVQQLLEKDGFEDTGLIVTSKNTYTAAFVNAEEPQYLVIEDLFPNGRPALEHAGIIFSDRETVNRTEKMKVCTCLNPLHTALAIYGCLLGFERIYEEMRDPTLRRMVERLGHEEGFPVVVNPGILDPEKFLNEVITERLPNPFMPDTPQRIACDTSQKLAIRFGETLKSYAAREGMDVSSLRIIPLVFAGWCRYLMGVDDKGEAFTISPDPFLNEVPASVKSFKLGDQNAAEALRPLLENKNIWGADLYELGIAGKVVKDFESLSAAPGAVRKTLDAVVLDK